jgi:hypothetical protein
MVDPDNMRVISLGEDMYGINYYYFSGVRLYQEAPVEEEEQPPPRKRAKSKRCDKTDGPSENGCCHVATGDASPHRRPHDATSPS